MAGATVTTTKIAMPIVFQAESQSMKKVFDDLKNQMSQVDLSSSLGKKFVKALEQMKKSADAYDTIAIKPTLDQTGLNTLKREFSNFWKYAEQLGRDVDFASVFDFNLSKEDISSLNTFSEKIKELNSQLTLLKKDGSKQVVGGALTAAGQTGLLERARVASDRFNSGKTARANAEAFDKQAAGARDQRSNLVERQTALQQAAQTLVAQQKQIEASLRTAEKEFQQTQNIVNRGNFLRQYEGLNEKILRTEGGRNRGQTAVLSAFMRPFEQGAIGGRVSETNRAGAESILRYLGFDAPTINALLQEQIPQIRVAIAKSLDIIDGSDEALSNEAYDRIQNVRARSRGYMRQYATDERYTRLGNQQNMVRGLRDQLGAVKADVGANAQQQQNTVNQIAEIDNLVRELDSVSDALRRFQQELDSSEINKLNDEIENQTNLQREASNNIRRQRSDPIKATIGSQVSDDDSYNYAGQLLKEQSDVQRETQQFTDNLKASIKHWMSAQQVINLVKDGARQAWTDIQGLDKAMTNIAVVTDMSTDDLWGKINEYMSIAQEYGVTTQGVYEVSQLYYQQGLSASEVMEATTETLKMARIAGMGYAEAADAMTVAIRGFKMEMSDAQTVTDVYSKVAAVTASDTEELATAMSKTASSAESVGSSFENTTAMLAVMIETTRESAQNLGSALKSIISRYGEMKVGLTVDSEGEDIDYNKVDTALKSVGISLKDAQGQFRDFDDVIFELSEKWDSLDKNTQRYIATIMAGNRQQSRFIALVDNWERLQEVSDAAYNSEDAGLLQYSKTLDSLETKLNNIKTSFQEFYMSVINGPFAKGVLDFINSILKGFNKLGNWQSILNIVSLVRNIKLIGSTILGGLSNPLSKLVTQYKTKMQEIVSIATTEGYNAGVARAQAEEAGYAAGGSGGYVGKHAAKGQTGSSVVVSTTGGSGNKTTWKDTTWTSWGGNTGAYVSLGASAVGLVASLIGSSIAEDNIVGGAHFSALSNVASGASMGAAVGPWGALVGGVIGLVASIDDLIDAYDPLTSATERYAKAMKKAEEADLERAEAEDKFINLESTIDRLNSLKNTRYDSEESYEEWIAVNEEALETFPELTSMYDENNNAIVDLIGAENELIYARKAASRSAKDAADAYMEAVEAEIELEEKKAQNFKKDTVIGDRDDSGYTQEVPLFFGTFSEAKEYKSGEKFHIGSKDYIDQYNSNAIWGYENVAKNVYSEDTSTIRLQAYYQEILTLTNYLQELNVETITWLNELDALLDKGDQSGFYHALASINNTHFFKDGAVNQERFLESLVGSSFTDIPTFLEDLDYYAEIEPFLKKQEQRAAQRTIATYVDATAMLFDEEDSFLALSGVNAIMSDALMTSFKESGQVWKDWVASHNENGYNRAQARLIASYENFYENLISNDQLDEFNTITSAFASEQITSIEFRSQLKASFGEEINEWDETLSAYYYYYIKQWQESITRTLKALSSDVRLINWEDAIEGENSLERLLSSIPSIYYDEVTSFAKWIDNSVTGGKLSREQANRVIQDYSDLWMGLSNLSLNQQDLGEARALVANADLTSLIGIKTFIEDLQKMGLTNDQINRLDLENFSIYTSNLITEWGILEGKLISSLTSATDALKQASSGISSLDEVIDMADKYGLNINDDFKFIEGEWIATEDALIKISEYYNNSVSAQKSLLEGEATKIQDSLRPFDVEQLDGIKAIPLEIAQNYSEHNFSRWQAVQTYWDKTAYTTWKDKQLAVDSNANISIMAYFTDYFANLGNNIDMATTAAQDYWIEQAKKDSRKALKVAELGTEAKNSAAKAGTTIEKAAANVSIAKKGLYDYTVDEMAEFAEAFGEKNWKLDTHYAYDVASGTYYILQEGLTMVEEETREAITEIINSSIDSAISSLSSITSKGEQITAKDVEKVFGDVIKGGNINTIKAWLTGKSKPVLPPNKGGGQPVYPLEEADFLAEAEEHTISILTDAWNRGDETGWEIIKDYLKVVHKKTDEEIAEYEIKYWDSKTEGLRTNAELALKFLNGEYLAQEDVKRLKNAGYSIGIDKEGNPTLKATEDIYKVYGEVFDDLTEGITNFAAKVDAIKGWGESFLKSMLPDTFSFEETLTAEKLIGGFSLSEAGVLAGQLKALKYDEKQIASMFKLQKDGTYRFIGDPDDILAQLEAQVGVEGSGVTEADTQAAKEAIDYANEWFLETLVDNLVNSANTLMADADIKGQEVADLAKNLGIILDAKQAEFWAGILENIDNPIKRVESMFSIFRADLIGKAYKNDGIIDSEEQARIDALREAEGEMKNIIIDDIFDSVDSALGSLNSIVSSGGKVSARDAKKAFKDILPKSTDWATFANNWNLEDGWAAVEEQMRVELAGSELEDGEIEAQIAKAKAEYFDAQEAGFKANAELLIKFLTQQALTNSEQQQLVDAGMLVEKGNGMYEAAENVALTVGEYLQTITKGLKTIQARMQAYLGTGLIEQAVIKKFGENVDLSSFASYESNLSGIGQDGISQAVAFAASIQPWGNDEPLFDINKQEDLNSLLEFFSEDENGFVSFNETGYRQLLAQRLFSHDQQAETKARKEGKAYRRQFRTEEAATAYVDNLFQEQDFQDAWAVVRAKEARKEKAASLLADREITATNIAELFGSKIDPATAENYAKILSGTPMAQRAAKLNELLEESKNETLTANEVSEIQQDINEAVLTQAKNAANSLGQIISDGAQVSSSDVKSALGEMQKSVKSEDLAAWYTRTTGKRVDRLGDRLGLNPDWEFDLSNNVNEYLASLINQGNWVTYSDYLLNVLGHTSEMIDEAEAQFWDSYAAGHKANAELVFKSLNGTTLTLKQINQLQDAGLVEASGELKVSYDNLIQRLTYGLKNYSERLDAIANAGAGEAILNRRFGIDNGLNETFSPETLIESISRDTANDLANAMAALNISTASIEAAFADLPDGTFKFIGNIESLISAIKVTEGDEAEIAFRTQYEHAQAWFYNDLTDTLLSGIKEIATAEEITAKSIADFYSQLGYVLSLENAQKLADTLEGLSPLERLEAQIEHLKTLDPNIEIDDEKYQELVASVFDQILATIEQGVSQLTSGLSGSLSETDFLALKSRFKLTGEGSRVTSQGRILGAEDQQHLIAGLYTEAQSIGREADFGARIWEVWKNDTNSIFKSYKDIEAELERINALGENITDETLAYVQALQQARDAAMLDENAYEFSFMEQDPTQGLTKNFDKFVSQIESVQTAFKSFKSGETIDYKDFANIMDFINEQGQFDSFIAQLGQTGKTYDEFVNGILAKSKEWGKIDIETIAAEMGVSVDVAMQAMSSSMTSGLKKVAEEQIKYLSGIEQMLLAFKALEGLGSVELSLGISYDTDGDGENDAEKTFANLQKFVEFWRDLDSQENGKEIKKSIILNFVNEDGTITANGQALIEAVQSIFGTEADWATILQSVGFDKFFDFASDIIGGQMSPETLQALAISMMPELDGKPFAEWGADTWTKVLQAYQNGFRGAIDSEEGQRQLQKILSNNYGSATLTIGTTEVLFNSDGVSVKIPVDQNGTPEEFKAQLIEEISRLLGLDSTETIMLGEIDAEAAVDGRVDVKYKRVDSRLATENAQLNYDEQQITYAGTDIVYDLRTATFSVAGETPEDPRAVVAEALGIDEGNLLLDVQGNITLAPALNTEMQQLKFVIASAIAEAFSAIPAVDLSTEEAQSALTALITSFEEMKEKLEQTVQIKANASQALTAIRFVINLLASLKNKTVTVTVNEVTGSGQNPSDDQPVIEGGGVVAYKGNVSGLALADGNASQLLRGAHFAGKTLVGELGPELAVYGDQYHLLGQNGAEFVDLPNDAIVFNHKQTEGIVRGQAGYRGKALANGNVEGPAAASGVDSALASVQRAKAIWQGLLNELSITDLLNSAGGGGGGSGNTIKAVNEELQEWYNLTRKIANIEQEINNLVAERANILEKDGAAYLRSLREEQRLKNDQITLQKTLLGYQELQLQRQADQINQNKIWSQFLEVDENGLLQYRKGNELNGGKGALEVLQQLNEMSGEAQVDYITKTLGYSYTNQDGEKLEGEELVQQFFQELQDQIDQYDALYDTVHGTEQTLESLKSQIEEINKEIKQNQMDLEQAIYDIIVEAWEAQIEHMEEQMELVEEANENYIDSLSEALQKERDIYAQNESISDREKLQRQLSLLRRSGGSASEIADLETQLDDLLQEEYFNKQEQMIEDIQKASEEQLRKLEEQITLQEEALEYQRENGVLWTKVYEVMSGSAADILAFMQGNSTEFFSQSLSQQEQMLTDWAHKIGIYDENKMYQGYRDYVTAAVWDNGAIWGMENMNQHKATYDKLSAEQAATVRNQFANEYAMSRLSGSDHDTALQDALEKIKDSLTSFKSQQEAPSHNIPVSGGSGNANEETTKKGYYSQKYTVTFTDGGEPATASGSGAGDTEAQAKANAQAWAKKKLGSRTGTISYGKVQFYAYSQGGLVDYTGLAMVHGKPGKPESFLNAEQTKLISDSLKLNSGDGVLDSIRATLAQLNTVIKSIINNNTNEISSFTVAPGAVTINVAELNDSYDVEELSKDVMNRMVAIASKSTSRGVNRR